MKNQVEPGVFWLQTQGFQPWALSYHCLPRALAFWAFCVSVVYGYSPQQGGSTALLRLLRLLSYLFIGIVVPTCSAQRTCLFPASVPANTTFPSQGTVKSIYVKEPSRVTKKYCAVAFHKKDTPASALTPGAGEYLRSRIPITPGFSSSFLILVPNLGLCFENTPGIFSLPIPGPPANPEIPVCSFLGRAIFKHLWVILMCCGTGRPDSRARISSYLIWPPEGKKKKKKTSALTWGAGPLAPHPCSGAALRPLPG
ncbi:uncharacterized protein LOC106510084 [Sus scrofa]|uniref:uncharacterized protein LOC106510084 n=1 Tax=Sus scrofa TaxID=9823 RepID=UPI0006B19B9C|nr:uncharacterized protein LOC106510084 [Sus scrofa]